MVVNAIIQARCCSTRLPNKVFYEIDGKPLLWHIVDRLTYAKTLDNIIIATTLNNSDDEIEAWCNCKNIKCYRGSEEDVLNRYYSTSIMFPADVIVRITADDPFKEPMLIDKVVRKLVDGNYDLVTNNCPPSFPEGLDCEAFTFDVLKLMEEKVKDSFEREHVTQYVYHNLSMFKTYNVSSKLNLSNYRWTIDTFEDYEMVKMIYLKRNKDNHGILLMDEILDILNNNPEIVLINSKVKRSVMYNK